MVTPNARYQLFETGGDPRYVQTDNRADPTLNPLSTGSATCIRVNADGTPFQGSGYSDGINGGVNVPLGYRVACTFVNQTAALTLLKNVVNDNGGSATASAWDLTATPAPLAGLVPDGRRVRDGGPGEHHPGTSEPRLHAHRVGRPGLRVLTAAAVRRRGLAGRRRQPEPGALPPAGRRRQLAGHAVGLGTPVYRFVNDDVAPILTLVKTVTNDNGGTALPTAWTLTATTPRGRA